MKYIIGYTISGHAVLDAPNPQAAAADAIGVVNVAVAALETVGEAEYRCPDGAVVRSRKKRTKLTAAA